MYFDDVVGDNTWLVSEFAGEPLAIDEFNSANKNRKIAANRYMRTLFPTQWWPHNVFIYHDFHHPKYTIYIADHEGKRHESGIRLR